MQLRLLLTALGIVILASDSALAQFPGFFLQLPTESRQIDGTANHPFDLGAANMPLLRLTTIGYTNGTDSPAGADRDSARAVSNVVAAQTGSVPNSRKASDFVWQWGQFIDHDIDLTEATAEAFDISVPAGDPYFDPGNTGTQVIGFDRSIFTTVSGVRQQLNEITAFIDASNVYGSDAVRAAALRTMDGTGRLKTSKGNLLPFNTPGLPNAGGPSPDLFLAGDVRANEQIGLTTMHTLFVREHNFWATVFRILFRHKSGDEIYQLARAMVNAEEQAITYNEFLPALLGPHALSPYKGYDPTANPQIANVFSTAAYRFGHSMLSPTLLRLKHNGQPVPAGNLELRDAFFNPAVLQDPRAGGIEALLRGLATQHAQEIDNLLVDDVRNFLFGPPGAGGFDLAALNIQRGRDHGMPDYNQVRIDFDLEPRESFAEISSNPAVVARLALAYDDVDDIDAWVGMLAEDHVPGSLVGETLQVILVDQFERLRDGDRFWYQRHLPGWMQVLAERSTLSEIIKRNTRIGHELQSNVFKIPH